MCPISKHPYNPFIPKNATHLIIGTIPPPRFCISKEGRKELKEKDIDFYYGSKDNYFWKIIIKCVNGLNLELASNAEAIKQRKEILVKLNMGITDCIESCRHKGGSASDNKLEVIKYKKEELSELLKKNSQIKTLIYTSGFVKTQMNAIFKVYHSSTDKERDTDKEREKEVTINGKTYNVIILYSPSPQALRGGVSKKDDRLRQYKKYFSLQ